MGNKFKEKTRRQEFLERRDMNLKKYDYYLVIDLEATCCDKASIPRGEMEIIEIGAVMVEAQSLENVSEFQTFIMPVRHPKLTPFCQELTTISQEQLDSAPHYPQAIKDFHKWLSNYSNYLFCSWGDYDKNQFLQDSLFHKVETNFTNEHANVKRIFADSQGFKKSFGMAKALRIAEIKLIGTHHRGIDDARNIAKLMPFVLGREKIKPKN